MSRGRRDFKGFRGVGGSDKYLVDFEVKEQSYRIIKLHNEDKGIFSRRHADDAMSIDYIVSHFIVNWVQGTVLRAGNGFNRWLWPNH